MSVSAQPKWGILRVIGDAEVLLGMSFDTRDEAHNARRVLARTAQENDLRMTLYVVEVGA